MYQRVILFLFMVLAVALDPSQAYAQTNMGESITRFVNSMGEIPHVISAIAYIGGIGLGVWAMFKIKDHVDNPMQTPLRAGVLRLLAGGGLLALPMVAEAVARTWVDAGWNISEATGRKGEWGAAPSGSMSLDEVLVALMSNIGPAIQNAIMAFCYIFGLIFCVIGLFRLTKHQQEGPRGPSGIGTLTTFAVAGALFSLGGLMESFTNSLTGQDNVFAYATLSFTGVSPGAVTQIELVTEAVITFMMILGWISFARGWFILKAVADGGGQASLMAGVTHIIGGALAVNLGALINFVQETLGLTPFGIQMS